MSYVAAFVAMFLLDFVWGKYTANVAKGNRIHASAWASGIVFFNSAVTLSIVGDPWTIIPAALGAFAGTFASMHK